MAKGEPGGSPERGADVGPGCLPDPAEAGMGSGAVLWVLASAGCGGIGEAGEGGGGAKAGRGAKEVEEEFVEGFVWRLRRVTANEKVQPQEKMS